MMKSTGSIQAITGAETLHNAALPEEQIEFCELTAPLSSETAWQVESLLLKIFEYTDYSIRSALAGRYSSTLTCMFCIAKHRNRVVAAAGCLYPRANSLVAIVGPVGVHEDFRRRGIATQLVRCIVHALQQQHLRAAYLAVAKTNKAENLYHTVGFRTYQGIVMRHLLNQPRDFDECYFAKDPRTRIRRADWGDFPGVLALAAAPARMHTFDFERGLFSSRYVEPARFLSIFPEMMRHFERYGGFAKVLVAKETQNVVGIAQLRLLPSQAQRHAAQLDFFVHDDFLEDTEPLVRSVLDESAKSGIRIINFCCLGCDHLKQNVIEALGARQIAVLPQNVRISGLYEDVFVYRFGEITNAKD